MADGVWCEAFKWRLCDQCNATLEGEWYETVAGTYCSEGCADEAECHDDGLMPRGVDDYLD